MPTPDPRRELIHDLHRTESAISDRDSALEFGLQGMRARRARLRVRRIGYAATLALVAISLGQLFPESQPDSQELAQVETVPTKPTMEVLTDEELLDELGNDRPYMIVGSLENGEIVFLD